MRWIESDLADKETIDIMVDINTTIYLLWASAESWLQKWICKIRQEVNTLRARVRYIRTSISAWNQQLSVALPKP